jgi:hypothetical protein
MKEGWKKALNTQERALAWLSADRRSRALQLAQQSSLRS